MNRVLVAGASGVVGFAAVKHFASLPGWDVVGLSRRPPARLAPVAQLVSVDLADAAACRELCTGLRDVTHLVYAALYEKPGLFRGWREQDQMERNRLMFANLLDALTDAAGDLTHVSLLQGTKAYGAHVEPMAVPGRERDPRHPHENFYWLQEDHLRAAAAGAPWSWTILRPQVVFGEAMGSNMNAIPALGVYAAVQRRAGRPLAYPGGSPGVSEAVDADLLARALAWAATTPAARGEIFNVTNGDVFTLRNVWPVLADAFGMETGEDRPCRLAEEMPRRATEWAAVVERFGLAAPTDLDAFVGQSFLYADLLTGVGVDRPRPPSLVSTIKIRRAGFADCTDTEDMFRRWIGLLQDERLLPPRRW
jgi:nucleoside-diphosphate-sugar epimerase